MFKNINSPDIKDDIVKRLEELTRWQEEQKKLLINRQNMQRQMLGIEQRKTYEMLGIFPDAEDVGNDDSTIPLARMAGLEQKQNFDKGEDVILQIHHEDNLTSAKAVINSEVQEAFCQRNAKKPFLRRGQGLKERFKIDPNALRLDNLPPYKYANSHPRLRNIQSQGNKRRVPMKVTKPAGQQSKKSESKESIGGGGCLDVQEQHFRQLFSTNNLSNSTPDVKIAKSVNRLSDSTGNQPVKVRFVDANNTPQFKQIVHEENSTNSEQSVEHPPISWAKVLDAQQIKPIPVEQIRSTKCAYMHEDTDENLSIFELLEEKANEGSIDMNSSCIKKFLSKKMANIQQDDDDIPVEKSLQNAGLQPSVINNSLIQSETEDEEEETLESTQTRRDSDYETTLTPDKSPHSRQTAVVVRFSDSNETHEYQEEYSETSSTDANESSHLDVLEQFKQALFTLLQSKDNSSSSRNVTESTISNASSLSQSSLNNSKPPPILSADLQAIMDRIKTRLAELEKEIATFKENNIQLIRAKQHHELEKAQFNQERLEALDKLNDEKIQMEIYLHDERMKIEEERRKFERQMQMQKTALNSKNRKELNQLKTEIEELQTQLKQKEQMHVAAQARLRVQIRNFEKDQKQLYDDIERLTKENKRLQNENLKISRENNNKMLQEINRNIAKLAPKLAQVTFNDNGDRRSSKEETNISSAKCRQTKRQPARSSLKSSKPVEATDYSSSDLDEYDHKSISGNNKKIESKTVDTEDVKRENQAKVLTTETQASINANAKADITSEFKREIINADGSKDILYSNGNLKKISPDGMSIRMLYFNKDIKETNINEGTVKYYYADTNTWHTTYLDGLEILEFPNGQTEHRYKNGIVEVHFPNNSIKVSNPADEHKVEEWRFADGTNLVEMRNGDKILTLPNGQKEIHTKQNKRREYPDGTVKIVYPDGSQETRYSNGRVRLKDKNGQLVMDTENVT